MKQFIAKNVIVSELELLEKKARSILNQVLQKGLKQELNIR